LEVGSYYFSEGEVRLEDDSFVVSPTADIDIFDVSITMKLYMNADLIAAYEGFEASYCAIESGPVRVNYNGTFEVNPHDDYAASNVNLSTVMLDDPSSVTVFSGCNLDLIDMLFDFADVDFSPTAMVDDRMSLVANAFEGLLEDDLEFQTELTCRP
jgi:hypothetical protein